MAVCGPVPLRCQLYAALACKTRNELFVHRALLFTVSISE